MMIVMTYESNINFEIISFKIFLANFFLFLTENLENTKKIDFSDYLATDVDYLALRLR